MNLLTKDQILSVVDLPRETVDVPEWNGSVLVSGISAKQRQLLLSSLGDDDDAPLGENQKAMMAAAFIIDEDGGTMFTEEDVLVLGNKSDIALDRVISVGMRLSGMSVEAIDDLAKN